MRVTETPSVTPPFGTIDDVQSWERDCVWSAYRRGLRSIAGEAATGTGKTFLAGLLYRDATDTLPGERPGLFLVHRKELLDQAVEEFVGQGLDVLEESGHKKAHRKIRGGLFRPHVVVATHQSLHAKRIHYFRRDEFGLCIVDEAHVSEAPSYKHVFGYFDFHLKVGLTATLFRMDGSPVYGDDAIYRERVFRYRINDAVKRGHLAPVEEVRLPVGINLKGIRMKGSTVQDVDPQELKLRVLPRVEVLVNAARQEIEKYNLQHVMIFAPDIESAKMIAGALRSLGYNFEAVWGEDAERDRKIKDFKAGKTLGLVNCELLTTGFNYKPIDGIFMFVATTSLVKFVQCVGRGTRLSPETGKSLCRVFGPEWTGVGGLRSSVDLFLEDPDNVRLREIAAEIRGKKPKASPQEVAEEADRELERLEILEGEAESELLHKRDLAAERNRVRRRELSYKTTHSLPFGLPEGGVLEPATPEQVKVLRKVGYADIGKLTRDQAEHLVRKEAERQRLGLATAKQVESLLKCRVRIDGRPITKERAEQLTVKEATRILLERWGKIPRKGAV